MMSTDVTYRNLGPQNAHSAVPLRPCNVDGIETMVFIRYRNSHSSATEHGHEYLSKGLLNLYL